MSTRSAIIVKGQGLYGGACATRLYKHCDGYPTDNLPLIRDAIKLASRLQAESNKRWKESKGITVDCFSGAVVAASLSVYGLAAQVEETAKDIASVCGNQGDIEWVYIVDLDAESVKVYRGSTYRGEFLKRGTVDPCVYADSISEEYKASEKRAIQSAVRSIKKLGFKVN